MAKEKIKKPAVEKPVETTTPPPIPPVTPLNASEQRQVQVIERVIENRDIAPQDAFGKLTRPQVDLIKRTIAKGASDDELRMFIQVCKGANLNPFMRQVHLVPRWDSKIAREVRTIQVGIDGFRAVAESSGQYAGNDDPIFDGEHEIEYSDKKIKLMVPQKATVTVYKMMDGQKLPFTASARWNEYYPGPKMGFQWHIRPFLMLGKCAEALALRKAFPKLLSGMYASEEMDRTAQADDDSKKIEQGFKTLINLIDKSTAEELKEFQQKMNASDKYTAKQKAEFNQKVDKKLKEIKEIEDVSKTIPGESEEVL